MQSRTSLLLQMHWLPEASRSRNHSKKPAAQPIDGCCGSGECKLRFDLRTRPRTNLIPTCCLRHARSSAQVADAMRRVFARRLVHPRFATVSSGEAAPQPPCISHARPDSPPPAASASSASLTEHMPRVASPSPASPNALRLTSSHHSAFAFANGGSGRKARAQPFKLAFTGCAGNVDSL